jgi:acetyl esterase/lipase
MTRGARLHLISAGVAILVGCGRSKEAKPRDQTPTTITSNESSDPWAVPSPDPNETLPAARAKFHTKLIDSEQEEVDVAPWPPPNSFRLVQYDAGPGKLAAYLTQDPNDGARHPAIIWITGGDSNAIGPVWTASDPADDQTAAQYREAGIVTMYPSLRGGHNNPGQREGFYGEVDDVLRAADFLAKESYVDPARIYLGGHSTGGTLVLLVAAAAPKDKFRAVFAFGPIHDVAAYGVPNPFCPFDTSNPREFELRSPVRWINTVMTPTLVFEGTEQGNLDSLLMIKARSKNSLVRFFPVKGFTHFNVLAPANKFLASQIIGPWSRSALELSAECRTRRGEELVSPVATPQL